MNYLIYFILIILTIYSDSPLQLQLSYFGRTFIPVIAFPAYFIMSANNALSLGDDFLYKYGRLIKYTIGISVLALLVFVLLGENLTQLGEFLPVKMIKLILIYSSYWVYIKVLINLAQKLTIKQVFKPFFIGLLLITVIAYIEVYVGEYVFNPIHFGDSLDREWDYNRVRLLCSESSFTAPLIEVFLGFSLYYAHKITNSPLVKYITYGCGILLIYTTGSKTLMLAVIIAIIYAFVASFRGRMKGQKVFVLLLFVFLSYGIYEYVLPLISSKFQYDIQESTSTVTRSYTVIMGYIVGTVSILGTGFQSYLAFFPTVLKDSINYIDTFFPYANLSEISMYLTQTNDTNLGAKSFFAQSSMYWGMFGTIYLVRSYWACLKSFVDGDKTKNVIFGAIAFIVLIQLLLSADMDYIVLSMLSVFIILKNKKVAL